MSTSGHSEKSWKDAKAMQTTTGLPGNTQTHSPELPNESALSSTTQQLKRFRFTQAYDICLLQAVRGSDAHVPEWGKTDVIFDKVLNNFLAVVPRAVFSYMNRPSRKTLIDRFKSLVAIRRADNRRNVSATGILEEYGEKEVLLDDLILEMDEKAEAVKVEKEELSAHEKKLIDADEEIRKKATKHKTIAVQSDGGTDISKSPGRKRARRLEASNSADDMTVFLLEQSKERQLLEQKRFDMEHERLKMERGRNEKDRQHFEASRREADSRLELERKRFEMEKEKRALALEERKQMIGLIEALTKKLH